MVARWTRSRTIGFLIFCALIGGCLAMLPASRPKTAAEAAAEKTLMAMIRCENQTEEQLADPEEFDPEGYGLWRIEPASENDLTFRFKARARNAFGASVWAEFECHATFDGEFWSAKVKQL